MHHCADHLHEFAWLDVGELGGLGLVILLFLTGIAASFTHCIGMCGPIAMTQMSMRLMALPADKMSEWNKFKCALSMPYYIGKAITYTLIFILTYAITSSVKDNVFFTKVGASFLMLMAFLFLAFGITRSVAFIKFPWFPSKVIEKLITRFKAFSINGYENWGVIVGMILGLIPCGVVYAAIATILAHHQGLLISSVAMFVFGIATIPGLFIISLLGEGVLSRNRVFFNIFYTTMMFFNAYLLLVAAVRLL